MSSITEEIQIALVARLRADAALAEMIGGDIYEDVPAVGPYPCVSLGPEDWPTVEADCLSGIEGTVQIDVWSRAPGRREAKTICDRIAAILHDADLELAAPYRAVSTSVVLRRILMDPDGETTHGVIQVAIEAEEGE